MKVIIIGAEVDGLICAIACKREQLDVIVLEQQAEIEVSGTDGGVAGYLGYFCLLISALACRSMPVSRSLPTEPESCINWIFWGL